MDFLLTKLLPLVFYPIGTVTCLAGISIILMLFRIRRFALLLMVTGFAWLWITSMPVVGDYLLRQLESEHPLLAVQDTPRADAAILLGGVVGYLVPPRIYPDLNTNAGRVVHTARLYQAGRVSRIIISGGNYPWGPKSLSEAELIADLLIEWGVSRDDILLETESRNTRENAINTAALVRQHRIGSTLLVTSGFHMPRAIATFRKVGLEAFPVPADFKAIPRPYQFPLDYLPQESGVHFTTRFVKEMLGLAVYRMKGWL